MNLDETRKLITKLVGEAVSAKGKTAPEMTDDTLLLGGPLEIDSLDLAALVVHLTDKTQRDPFADGFVEFRTVGELARLYAA
jgi:acyl carrier protein